MSICVTFELSTIRLINFVIQKMIFDKLVKCLWVFQVSNWYYFFNDVTFDFFSLFFTVCWIHRESRQQSQVRSTFVELIMFTVTCVVGKTERSVVFIIAVAVVSSCAQIIDILEKYTTHCMLVIYFYFIRLKHSMLPATIMTYKLFMNFSLFRFFVPLCGHNFAVELRIILTGLADGQRLSDGFYELTFNLSFGESQKPFFLQVLTTLKLHSVTSLLFLV